MKINLATIGRAVISRCGKVPPTKYLAMFRGSANIGFTIYSGGAWGVPVGRFACCQTFDPGFDHGGIQS
jgi:hypothetical protein